MNGTDRTIRPAKRIVAGLNTLLDFFLPRHCIMCGLPSGDSNLCPPCRADLPVTGDCCTRCGLLLPGTKEALCGACLQRPPLWDGVVAALDYRFPVDTLVHSFKFRRNMASGEVLAEELSHTLENKRVNEQSPRVIVPVPLHRTRHAARTFNQSELIARHLGRQLGIPVDCTLLSRVRRTHAQSGLDARSRRRNTRGAFHCHPGRLGNVNHVALVDDVMTTGATLEACTRELKRCGAGKVSIWVVARAPPP